MDDSIKQTPLFGGQIIVTTCESPEPSTEPKYLEAHHIPRLIRKGAFPNHEPSTNAFGVYGMHRTVEGVSKAAARCLKALTPIAGTFDALYVTGQSGLVPASVVAHKLKKDLIILRKKGEESHGCMVEGEAYHRDGVRYVIVDDFVSRAGTLDRLVEYAPRRGELVAICLYGHPRTDREVHIGFAKVWQPLEDENSLTRGDYWKRLIRRGPRSLLFDLVIEPGWVPSVV